MVQEQVLKQWQWKYADGNSQPLVMYVIVLRDFFSNGLIDQTIANFNYYMISGNYDRGSF